MYFMPGGKSLESLDRDQVPIVPTITTASQDFERQRDRDSDTKHKMIKTHLFANYMTPINLHTVNNSI
jgi:hypothetical protein